jgi:O-antigen ligase
MNDPIVRRLDRVVDVGMWTLVIAAPLSAFMLQIAALGVPLAWLARTWRTGGLRTVRLPLIWPMLAFLVASGLSATFAVDKFAALREIRSAWAFPLLFWATIDRLGSVEATGRKLIALIAAGCVTAAYGIGQTAVLGIEHRAIGFQTNWMTFSEILVMIIAVALARLLLQTSRRVGLWLGAAVVLMAAGVVLSQTRGAWIALAVAALIVLWGWRRWAVLILPIAALLVAVSLPHQLQARWTAIAGGTDVTVRERVYLWRAGGHMLRDRPLLGVGPGNPALLRDAYKEPDDPWLPERKVGHLHSNLFEIAAGRGLLGLLAWGSIWVAFLFDRLRAYRHLGRSNRAGRALALGGLAAVSAFLVAGLTEYTFGDSEVLYLTAWLMALPYVAETYNPGGIAESRGGTVASDRNR